MRLNYKYLCVLLAFFAFACGSKKKVAESAEESKPVKTQHVPRVPIGIPSSVEEYIAMYAPIARQEMAEYQIPASITLAQGILESGAGQSQLTLKSNNHFGIKCHGWEGEGVYHDDDKADECFRKYNDPRKSFRDHSLFLSKRGRYSFLFDLDIDDYKGWAKGLREAGYATDKKYPEKLISLIERYELYKYDQEVLHDNIFVSFEGLEEEDEVATTDHEVAVGVGVSGEREVSEDVEAVLEAFETGAGRNMHMVKKGETLYSISRLYNLSVAEIKKSNNLRSSNIEIGQLLRVAPPEVAEGKTLHVVKKGETLFAISRKYGISVEEIKESNNLRSNNLSVGQRLYVEPVTAERGQTLHVVQKGETLFSISRRYNLSVAEIKRSNHLPDNNIRIGQRLIVTSRAASADVRHHVVKKEETLYSISRRYGLSVEELKSYNNLKGNIISVGQWLYVEPLD